MPQVIGLSRASTHHDVVRLDAVDVQIHHGDGFSYYTTQPAPHQWVAVGTMVDGYETADGTLPARLVVGTGRTEAAAIDDLYERVRAIRALPSVTDLGVATVASAGGA